MWKNHSEWFLPYMNMYIHWCMIILLWLVLGVYQNHWTIFICRKQIEITKLLVIFSHSWGPLSPEAKLVVNINLFTTVHISNTHYGSVAIITTNCTHQTLHIIDAIFLDLEILQVRKFLEFYSILRILIYSYKIILYLTVYC